MPNHEGVATAFNEGYRVMKRTGPCLLNFHIELLLYLPRGL